MPDFDDAPEIDNSCLNRIRERTLQIEKRHLHQEEAKNIVPELKNVIEEEIKGE